MCKHISGFNKKSKANKQSGMTLMEALVSVFIFSIIVGLMLLSFTVGKIEWNIDETQLDVYQPLRQAMDGMSREIRQSTPGNVEIPVGGEEITFFVSGSQVRYYLDGTNLMREHPEGTTQTIAQNITSLNFSISGSVVIFTVGGSKPVSGRDIGMELTEKVSLRN